MASGDDLSKMVKTINENPNYKVLTKEEYNALLALASQRGESKQDTATTTSTPKPSPAEFDGTKPKAIFTSNVPLAAQSPAFSPIPRLSFPNLTQQQNVSTFVPNSYVPKLPIFSGAEEPQKGETTYEVWNLEVKCLQKSGLYAGNERLLIQAIRNSLKGTARSMLVPLGEDASVKDILAKLDGFYGNVSTSETLIQSFYNDFQKDNESIVSFGSWLEQTLSRAVKYGHIDLAAKDAMLRSKFWTGLKSQVLKNSTRHLYDSIKDFSTLLREIRKVDSEESSSKPVKKQAAQQQLSGQVSTDDTSSQLLKQMTELMGRMKNMEDKLEEQNKVISAGKKSSQQDNSANFQYTPRGRGRGYGRGSWKGNYGRGYQSGTPNHNNNQSSQRGFKGGYSQRGYRGGTSGRGANSGDSSEGNKQSLNA